MNFKKNIFSFPLGVLYIFSPTYAGGKVMSFPKGKLFYISTRICRKTEIFQDFIRLKKSVSVLQYTLTN